MKPEPPPPQVASPCTKDWSQMAGDEKRRFCSECRLQVHNLSAMLPAERARFVGEMSERTCITYTVRADGTMVSATRWGWMLRPWRAAVALLAALLPFAFSSCTTRRTMGAPLPPANTPAHADEKLRCSDTVLGRALPKTDRSQ